jgi:hypothetical protein
VVTLTTRQYAVLATHSGCPIHSSKPHRIFREICVRDCVRDLFVLRASNQRGFRPMDFLHVSSKTNKIFSKRHDEEFSQRQLFLWNLPQCTQLHVALGNSASCSPTPFNSSQKTIIASRCYFQRLELFYFERVIYSAACCH